MADGNAAASRRLAQLLAHMLPAQGTLGLPQAAAASGAAVAAAAEEWTAEAMRREVLEPDNQEIRNRLKALFMTPDFAISQHEDLDLRGWRELTVKQFRLVIREIFGSGLLSVDDAVRDPLKFLAFFEPFGYHGGSVFTALVVHFGLFAGAILNLGTAPHIERYREAINSASEVGFFALTELGHGSNVRGIQTEAHYDAAAGEFDIHTPSDAAQKYWIGNTAELGTIGVVFAQLMIDGRSEGVHGFVVRLRDATSGAVARGIRVMDCGVKTGLNGVANGRLWFDHVRVPRDALLDRLGQVDAAGRYSSPLSSPAKRFGAMMDSLLAGRVVIANFVLSSMKIVLTSAIRYNTSRRQFGPGGGDDDEYRLIDYLSTQRRLMVGLARVFAASVAAQRLKQMFADRRQSDGALKAAHIFASGLKAYNADTAMEVAAWCREACGGQALVVVNRLGLAEAELAYAQTLEGVGVALRQQVAKELLGIYARRFRRRNRNAVAVEVATDELLDRYWRDPLCLSDASEAHVLSGAFQRAAMHYRERRLTETLAKRLFREVNSKAVPPYDAWNGCLDHVEALSDAYTEARTLDCYLDLEQRCSPPLRPVLAELRALWALWRIERDIGFWCKRGMMSYKQARAVTHAVNKLCRALVPAAPRLLDAFALPLPMLQAPIAGDWLAAAAYVPPEQRTSRVRPPPAHAYVPGAVSS